jgi:Domain of unknown function (DUF4390)
MITRMRALGLVMVLMTMTTAVVVQGADAGLRITPTVSNDRLLVSLELDGADVAAVREAIASGLRTTFTYELELRTIVPGWIDRTIATTVVTMSDRYDNLTRRHTLSRSVDGRVEDVTVTEDETIVQSWLTKLSRVPLYNTSRLDPSRDYYVRITSRARPFGGSLLGLTRTLTGSAKFTVVP